MSQFDAFSTGGGTNADFYRRAREYEQQNARKRGLRAGDQARARRYKNDPSGTADHSDQLTLLADANPQDTRLVSDSERERKPFEDFRSKVLDVLYDARLKHNADFYLRDFSPRGVRYREQDGAYIASVEVGGYRFEATGTTREMALIELSASVAGGPAKALGKVEKEEVRVGERNVSQTGETAKLEAAGRHFRARQRKIQSYGDRVPDGVLALTEADRRHAEFLGARIPEIDSVHILFRDRAVRAAMQLVSDQAFDFGQPAESAAAVENRMEYVERRRTDRYGPSH